MLLSQVALSPDDLYGHLRPGKVRASVKKLAEDCFYHDAPFAFDFCISNKCKSSVLGQLPVFVICRGTCFYHHGMKLFFLPEFLMPKMMIIITTKANNTNNSKHLYPVYSVSDIVPIYTA